jgi:hypothetical protein
VLDSLADDANYQSWDERLERREPSRTCFKSPAVILLQTLVCMVSLEAVGGRFVRDFAWQKEDRALRARNLLVRAFTVRRKTKFVVLIVAAAAFCLQSVYATQSRSSKQTKSTVKNARLEQKLAQRAGFVPQAKSALDQLIEVAKHFEIPMDIEWAEESDPESAPLAIANDATVEELLHAIVKPQSLVIDIDNGIVRVYSPSFSNRPNNILNLRVGDFQVRNVNLFDSEEELMLAIDAELHPHEYTQGYHGGYGYDPTHVFAVRNINFSGKNVTVRQALNGITKSNSNALWVVRSNPAFKDQKASLGQVYKDRDALAGLWQFIPLRESTAGSNHP